MSFLAVFTQEEDGKFSVSVPALPGCFSQGKDLNDAKKNIKEAITLYLEDEQIDPSQQGMQVVSSIDVSVAQ